MDGKSDILVLTSSDCSLEYNKDLFSQREFCVLVAPSSSRPRPDDGQTDPSPSFIRSLCAVQLDQKASRVQHSLDSIIIIKEILAPTIVSKPRKPAIRKAALLEFSERTSPSILP